MAIVPAGSGNGLARELGIDATPGRALAAAIEAAPHAIDLGEIGGRLFASLAGIGVDAHVAARFDAPTNRQRGLPAYVRHTLGELFRHTAEMYRISIGGQSVEVRAVLVTVANSAQFGNGVRIAPGARVDDGLLDLVAVTESSRIATICQAWRLLAGSVERVKGWSTRRVERATIESERPMLFHVDGEPVHGETRLDVRVHPGALLICGGKP